MLRCKQSKDKYSAPEQGWISVNVFTDRLVFTAGDASHCDEDV
jgi:hypothetical protein